MPLDMNRVFTNTLVLEMRVRMRRKRLKHAPFAYTRLVWCCGVCVSPTAFGDDLNERMCFISWAAFLCSENEPIGRGG